MQFLDCRRRIYAVQAAVRTCERTQTEKWRDYIINYAKTRPVYDAYRKARNEMQELMKAQKNVELFFAEDKSNLRPQHTR